VLRHPERLPEREGIQHAVRTLSPQAVVCDEIGGLAEAESILEGIHCGAKFIAAAMRAASTS
jgi:stage III sporulation protein AA